MAKTLRVVPAVLTDSSAALVSMLRQAELFTDWVQIDIMDGNFVPSVSIGADEIVGAATRIGWEAHLMVSQPERYVEDFQCAGARKIIVHYEAVKNEAHDVLEHITSLGMDAGLALNPETRIEELDEVLLGRLRSILFMAVNPGFYGAKFIPEVLDKIKSFRRHYPEIQIGIDGGIKAANIAGAALCGADEICVGSAIFAQHDPAASYRELTRLAKSGWSARAN